MLLARFYKVDTERNKGIVVTLGRWPARSLKHRGCKHIIFERAMTEAEYQITQVSDRYHAYRYDTLDDLLADEAEILGEDSKAFESAQRILKDILSDSF